MKCDRVGNKTDNKTVTITYASYVKYETVKTQISLHANKTNMQ